MNTKENCGLMIVDVQGRLARLVNESEQLVASTLLLVKSCQLLNLPIIVLEQNPSGLGHTIDELKNELIDAPVYTKMHFSGLREPTIKQAVADTGRINWLLAGIESHICVYQTASDLLNETYKVNVVVDCVSSREPKNKQLALSKLSQLGAELTSVEMITYELMQTCQHPSFKSVLRLFK